MSTRKTAEKVLAAFEKGEIQRGATLWTAHNVVYSYEMPIAHKVGTRVYIVKKGPSVTTSKHINWVKGHFPIHTEVTQLDVPGNTNSPDSPQYMHKGHK